MKNPNYGIYPFEELQAAGAFLGECGQIGEQCYGIPDNHYTSVAQLAEEKRARRILDMMYANDASKEKLKELKDVQDVQDVEMLRASIYQTYKNQPALQKYYTWAEYIKTRLRMLGVEPAK